MVSPNPSKQDFYNVAYGIIRFSCYHAKIMPNTGEVFDTICSMFSLTDKMQQQLAMREIKQAFIDVSSTLNSWIV
jgi:hypothetical protein